MANCNTKYNNDKPLQENFYLSGGQIALVVILTIFGIIAGGVLLSKLVA